MLAYGAGGAAAFDILYARHKGGVYRYLLRHCRNAGTADELFQDVWMNAIRVRTTYVPTAKFTTWLYCIATAAWSTATCRPPRRPSPGAVCSRWDCSAGWCRRSKPTAVT